MAFHLKPYVQLARPQHWLKNCLVLLPIVFSGHLLDVPFLVKGLLELAAFCLCASAVYTFNDLKDAEFDRLHPTKKNRPIASGAVSIGGGFAFLVAALIGSAALDYVVNARFSAHSLVLVAYFLMNVAYSVRLKNYPIIDVTILSLGFLLRVIYGGLASGIQISTWLFLTIISLAFFFSLGKRRNELRVVGGETRKSLTGGYSEAFLDRCMYVFLALGLAFYALWATIGLNQHESAASEALMLVTVIIAMVTCMQYCLDIERGDASGDPVTTVFEDKTLLAAIVAWLGCLMGALYL